MSYMIKSPLSHHLLSIKSSMLLENITPIGLCIGTYFILKGGWIVQEKPFFNSLNSQALIMASLSIIAAVGFFGISTGTAFILTIVIHEYGHVAAFRVAGHHDATFRLVPLMGGVAISARKPDSQMHDFFITLMGPAICIAPTILAMSLAPYIMQISPIAGRFLYSFYIISATINFFNLMPFWPLDGARCIRIIVFTYSPKLANGITMIMSLTLAAFALYKGAYFTLLFAFMLIPSAFHAVKTPPLRPATTAQSLLASAAYITTILVFYLIAPNMITQYL